MTPVEKLLARLDGVRRVGEGRWMARSPAFPDQRTGSLSIRELDDGRVLLHDFAGCEVQAVLALLGLEFSDLFPDQRITGGALKPIKQAHSALAALRTIEREARVVAIAADSIARGCAPTDADIDRLVAAAASVREALEVCR